MKDWSPKMEFNLLNINHSNLSMPGVYTFWRGEICIYVGISKNIRGRLLQHFENCHNPNLKAWIRSHYTLHFRILSVHDRRHQQMRERTLIKRLNPSCNVAHT